MSCDPTYPYVPDFTPSGVTCSAPVYATHRSRVTTEGDEVVTALFFRSKDQTFESNQIEVELVDDPAGEFRVYFNGILVTTYPVLFQAGAIAQLRNDITNDVTSVIEMPVLGDDIYDERAAEDDDDGILIAGIAPFDRVFLTGGVGAPEDDAGLALIRTGPQRTIFIVASKEDVNGTDVQPPPSERIQQWDGFSWISYCNNIPGQCPGEGTC